MRSLTGRIRLLMDSANIDLIMKDGKIYKNTLETTDTSR
jgi:hypothetical protein